MWLRLQEKDLALQIGEAGGLRSLDILDIFPGLQRWSQRLSPHVWKEEGNEMMGAEHSSLVLRCFTVSKASLKENPGIAQNGTANAPCLRRCFQQVWAAVSFFSLARRHNTAREKNGLQLNLCHYRCRMRARSSLTSGGRLSRKGSRSVRAM